jgi:hypothetical protein
VLHEAALQRRQVRRVPEALDGGHRAPAALPDGHQASAHRHAVEQHRARAALALGAALLGAGESEIEAEHIEQP